MQAYTTRLSEELQVANHKIKIQNELLQAANNCVSLLTNNISRAHIT